MLGKGGGYDVMIRRVSVNASASMWTGRTVSCGSDVRESR